MSNPNRLTIFAHANWLQFGLWSNATLLHSETTPLQANYLEQMFPLWKQFTTHPKFNWTTIRQIYFLNGPNKFALLRTLLTSLNLLRLFHPQWTFYTLNHCQFQVATAQLTLSLITANKKHYYAGWYQAFVPLQPLQMVTQATIPRLLQQQAGARVVTDFKTVALAKLWANHWSHFHRCLRTQPLQAVFLHPFRAKPQLG